MPELQEAVEWFDQFVGHPDFARVQGSGQWCARHWAPCPMLGANGLGASIELISVFAEEVAAPGSDSAALTAQMQAAGRLCCTLGDERMYELWGHWPPAGGGPDA